MGDDGMEPIGNTLTRETIAQVWEELEISNLQPKRMEDLTLVCSWNPHFRRSMVSELAPYVQDGIPPRDTDPDGYRDWLKVRKIWRKRMRLQFSEFCVSQFSKDPTKFLAMEAVLSRSGSIAFWMLNPNVLVSRLIFAGRFGYAVGLPDSGKTDTMFKIFGIMIDLYNQHERVGGGPASDLVRLVATMTALDSSGWAKRMNPDTDTETGQDEVSRRRAANKLGLVNSKGIRVIVNAQVSESPYSENFAFAPSLLVMTRLQAENTIAGKMSPIGFDEIGTFMPRERPNSREALQLVNWCRLLRKKNSTLFGTTQNESDIHNRIDKWFTTRIWKRGPYNARIDIEGMPGWRHRRVSQFTSSADAIPFSSLDPASFEVMDIDVAELDRQLSQYRLDNPVKDAVGSAKDLARLTIEFCEAQEKRNEAERAVFRKPVTKKSSGKKRDPDWEDPES